jgi:branched-chain amino acid transport system substrate-binding protein
MRFSDPKNAPWTMPLVLSQQAEAHALANYALNAVATPRVAVLYQNDDLGRDYLHGFLDRLRTHLDGVVQTASYEVTDPTVDSQIIELHASGANVLFDAGIPRFTALAIRKIHDIGWNPLHIIVQPSASIPTTFVPAGLEKCIGIVGADYLKLPGSPQWAGDPDLTGYRDLLQRHAPGVDANDRLAMVGYYCAASVAMVIAQCGNELTRERLMYEATHMNKVRVPGLLPGVALRTSPSDYSPIKQMQLQQFDGTRWQPIGVVVEG